MCVDRVAVQSPVAAAQLTHPLFTQPSVERDSGEGQVAATGTAQEQHSNSISLLLSQRLQRSLASSAAAGARVESRHRSMRYARDDMSAFVCAERLMLRVASLRFVS